MIRGGASSLNHLWKIPSTQTLLKSSNFYKGSNLVPGIEIYQSLKFCKGLQSCAHAVAVKSYVPTAKDPELDRKEKNVEVELESVGAFQKLPMVMPAVDILQSAMKKARRIPPTKGIANIAKRERNKGAKQLDALMKELGVPLRVYTESFPNKNTLHPYERSLIELTLGDGHYEQVLCMVDSLRKKVVSVGKEHASLCAKSLTKREAVERLTEGVKQLEVIFGREGRAIDDLLTIAKVLRQMPVVDLETPTLCLVGAPNVGKSSLVRILSTGKPEVCNYPFTTRGILMGHIKISSKIFQVTDTPGLLNRHDEDRNNLEKLTLAVLSHLPTAILYVHDLSGQCGTSPTDQFVIYKEIKEKFGDHLWLDVVSKCDLLKESPITFITEDPSADNPELASYRKSGPEGSIHVSLTSEIRLDELKDKVYKLMIAQLGRIERRESSDSQDTVVFA